jgi:D-arabinose 1-dehydrogenase-like Zn-dependent alcohol dehydrogenase
VERDIPEPGAAQVRIKVQACGVCHSDSFTKEGLFQGIQYPRIPGHEIARIIDKVGKNVTQWEPRQRCWLVSKDYDRDSHIVLIRLIGH